jgi:hypothetical protein
MSLIQGALGDAGGVGAIADGGRVDVRKQLPASRNRKSAVWARQHVQPGRPRRKSKREIAFGLGEHWRDIERYAM